MLSTTKLCWAASLNPPQEQHGLMDKQECEFEPLLCTGSNFWPVTGLAQDVVCAKFRTRPGHHSSWCGVAGPQLHWMFCGQTWCWDYQGNQQGFRDLHYASISSFVPEFKALQWSQNAAWVSSLELQSTINNGWNFLVPSCVSSLVANGQSGHLHPQQMGQKSFGLLVWELRAWAWVGSVPKHVGCVQLGTVSSVL